MSDRSLIVGLGNPGRQYENTRHNIGFTVIEALGRRAGIVGKAEKRFEAMIGTGRIGSHPVILAQPLTYMNLSGQAVGKLLSYYEIPQERLLVVYDEAALAFGRLRFRPSGSDAGQKGVRSIIQTLGGSNLFPRLRLGIGSPPPPMAMADYVLSRFSSVEQADLPKVVETALDGIQTWLDDGTEAAMARYNGFSILPAKQKEEISFASRLSDESNQQLDKNNL